MTSCKAKQRRWHDHTCAPLLLFPSSRRVFALIRRWTSTATQVETYGFSIQELSNNKGKSAGRNMYDLINSTHYNVNKCTC